MNKKRLFLILLLVLCSVVGTLTFNSRSLWYRDVTAPTVNHLLGVQGKDSVPPDKAHEALCDMVMNPVVGDPPPLPVRAVRASLYHKRWRWVSGPHELLILYDASGRQVHLEVMDNL